MKRVVILAAIFFVVVAGASMIYNSVAGGSNVADSTADAHKVVMPNLSVSTATDFEFEDFEGNTYSLSDFKGKPVVVNFWATWCGYCVQEMPFFELLAQEYGDRVQFIMLDLVDGQGETKELASEFVKEKNFTFPVFYDYNGSAAKAYGINSIPMTLFIDKNGNLFQKNIGAMNEESLRSYIEVILE